jgi:hypothetical protein
MSTKRNDGKKLEYVVALVEGSNLPDGFKVDKNQPVRNDNGDQIAELDIVVSGKIGTVDHKTLFECRDRPSDGPQGSEWIQQLLGRRQLLNLDTVVAVSSTGFAPGAIDLACRSNIHLRTVEELTAEDVQHFLPMRAPLVYLDASFYDVKLVVIPEDETIEQIQAQGGEHERVEYKTADKILHDIQTGGHFSLLQLWQQLRKLYDSEIFSGVSRVGDEVKKDIVVRDDMRNALRVELPDKPRGQILELIYKVTVKVTQSQLPLAYCVTYDGRHVIAHWEGDGEEANNVTVILTKKDPEAG